MTHSSVRSAAYEEVPGMTEWTKIMLVIIVEGREDWEQKGKREVTRRLHSLCAALQGGAPKDGAPKGGGPKEGAPKEGGPKGVGGPKGGGPKISRMIFFPSPATIFFLSSLSWGLLVEFWWYLKRRGPEMSTFGVLGLSCEAPAGLAEGGPGEGGPWGGRSLGRAVLGEGGP